MAKDRKRPFLVWMTPQSMLEAVHEAWGGMPQSQIFNEPQANALLEAWIAANFGLARDAESVRLIDAERPDAEFIISGELERFELTEADEAGRRRGLEYRHQPESVTVRDFNPTDEEVLCALERSAARKAAITYPVGISLLIYLNLPHGEHMVEQFPGRTRGAGERFRAVWVLSQKKTYRVWDHGVESQGTFTVGLEHSGSTII